MEADAFLVKLIEHNPYAMWISDEQGTLVWLNQACRDLFCIRDEKAAGRYNLFHDEIPEAQGLLPVVRQVFADGKAARFRCESGASRLQNPGLKGTVMDATISPVLDSRGRVTHAIFQGIDITENKRAEEALRQSEEKYRLIAENTADVISISDMNLRFTYISPSVRALHGFTPEEAMKQTLDRILPPESLKTTLAAFEEEMRLEASGTADPNRTLTLKLEEYRRDGSLIPVEVRVSYLRDKDRKPVAMLAVTRDMTERKRAEAALRRSEESALRLAQEHAVMAEIGRIIGSTLNIAEVYALFSEKVGKLIPYDRITINEAGKEDGVLIERYVEGEPVPGRGAGNVFPKAGSMTEAVMNLRKGLILDSREGGEIAAPYPGLAPEIRAGYRSFLSVPLISGDRPIGGLHFRSKRFGVYREKDLALAESIGNQIAGAIANARLYAERKRAEEAVRESERKLMTVFQSFAIPAFIIDKDHKILHWNNALAETSGLGSAEVIGTDRHWEAFYREKRPCLADLLADGRADLIPKWYAGRFQKSKFSEEAYEGTEFFPALGEEGKWLHFTAAAIRDSRGNLVGAIETLKDITEHRRAEEDLRRSVGTARRLAAENEAVAEIGRIISSTINIEEVYERFAEEAGKIIRFDRITVSIFDLEQKQYFILYTTGADVPGFRKGDRRPIRMELLETAGRHRPGIIFQVGAEKETQGEEEIRRELPTFLPLYQAGLRSFMRTPLMSKDEAIGSLNFLSRDFEAYTESDLRAAERIANQIAGAVANAQLFAERKRAVEALRESEERYRVAEKLQETGHFEWDVAGDRIAASPSLESLHGLKPGEFQGSLTAWFERIHPEDRQQVDHFIRDFFWQKRTEGEFEVRIVRPDGEAPLLLGRARASYDDRKKPIRVFGAMIDITGRRRAEDALRRSEKEAQRLLQETVIMAEIGRIVSSTLDVKEVYDRFAAEVKKLVPFDRISINEVDADTGTGTTIYTTGLFIPGRKAGDSHPLSDSATGELARSRSGLLVREEGMEEFTRRHPAYLPCLQAGVRSMAGAPLLLRDRVVGALILDSLGPEAYSEQDLKLVERIGNQIAGAVANARLYQKEKRMERELLKSEERYRFLVDLSPLMVFTHRQGKFMYLNSAAVKALGASKAEDLAGRSVYEVIHPDCWDLVKERIRRIEQGKSVPPVEEKYIRLDRQVIDVELNHVQILDPDGPTVLIMGRDITEQKKAERDKAVLQEQLQQAQKMEAIGTLAGGIAHDFNNILAAILGYAELAGLDIPERSKARYNLQQSIKSAHRAKDLVKQILTFSRQGTQERKPLDIRPIVKETLKFLRSSLPTTIEIRQEIEKDPGAIEADPTQVYQVLMNLCTNAAHAMAERGGVLEVSLAKADLEQGTGDVGPGPYLRLRVRDTGCGMPPDILKKIFDPYFTTKEVGKGTGLGLAVVHGIVKSCGGGVAVSSEEGKGSAFDVYFPRIGAARPGLAAGKAEPLPLGKQERILFVDDEQMIVEFGQKILEHLGYEVSARTSSVEALELFRAKADRFDLVITDMTMPNLTGEKLARKILEIRPGIPIILCTGFSEYMSEEKAKALGIREFVLKPLVMKDLAKAIRRALDSRKGKKG